MAKQEVKWNRLLADEVDRLLNDELKAHPIIACHEEERDNLRVVKELMAETKKWRRDSKWAMDEFFRDYGRCDLSLAGLIAFKSIMEGDRAPKSKPKRGKLVKPKIRIGDHEVDGDLDLDETGPMLVTGSLHVHGSILGRGSQGGWTTPGNPLFVGGNLRCSGMNLAWRAVVDGDLDAGDLLLCDRKGDLVVSGTIRARVVLGREMEWGLWNARHPIEAEFVELSRYEPKAGKNFDRTAEWWSALGEVIKPGLLAKHTNLWTPYRKSPKIFNGPPKMRRWHNVTFPGVPLPLQFLPED